jgi:signal transduction histidine kinase
MPHNRKAFLSLRSRVALSFGGLFALILIIVNLAQTFGIPGTSDRGFYGEARSDVLRNLSLVADLKKERLLLWLDERKGDVALLSQNDRVKSAVSILRELIKEGLTTKPDDRELRSRLIAKSNELDAAHALELVVRAYGVYLKIQLVDAESGIIIASTEKSYVGTKIADRLIIGRTVKEKGKTIFDMYESPATGQTELLISHAVQGSSSSVHGEESAPGLVVCYIDPEAFIKPLLYTGGGLGRSGDIVLVNQDLRILISLKFPLPDGSSAEPLEYRIEAEPARLAAGGKEGIVISKDYRDEPVLAAYRHIEVTPQMRWGMVVKRDQSDVFGPIKRGLLYSSLIGLLGILGAAVLAVVIANRISRPIESLSRTAEQVEAGRLEVQSQVTGSDEVGRLAATFNSMISRIGNWHAELEEQVEKRTSELRSEIEERARVEKERERLIEVLETKNAELELFTYTVSHDLKSPLITINSFVGFAGKDAAEGDQETLKEDLETISDAASSMGRLLEGLLELSRIGRLTGPPTELPFGDLAQEAVRMVAGSIAAHEVEVRIAPDLPTVCVDRPRLVEVLQNLIENAIKFMGDQPIPQIDIGTRQDDGETVFYVRDNGMGIDPRYHDTVFGLFDKLNQNTEGTGLGLALVKRIVEVHGGLIWVESTGDGQGTTFCFTLKTPRSTEELITAET